ncbi:UDP-N-acetylglucosamine 2-epimerase (non-hydrolyzing) [Coprococcus sp. AF19-8AC]|uniref:non-hydrolyzing UDP-N-acetylglucosamine 2-epimerase n=1 Tax=Coprococcus sp. AF19-8AC TaxID=2293090 RepID=UPI000E73096F|nr:UDP-N-acetylglucosamine 2-epimerase (non-hydrolyzing) [Coprococcus sp. AF19-8AC]RJV44676.1 UDP-N-acetylglucosamine 2-epimerase (non-hydrolyzing) [Coprococcus sp. AF19-8AC]
MKKILIVFGTRPEAIKMCPLVLELKRRKKFDVRVCVTGQHREMLDTVLKVFDVVPDYDLNIMQEKQTLFDITIRILDRFSSVLENYRPNMVLVHGDTTTSFASALCAFYKQIPVAHVEAGLRTHNLREPFPEEFNRQAVSIITKYHFAPTEHAKNNLLMEGKSENSIFVTGNTVIDAMKITVSNKYFHEELKWADGSKLVLMTAHRRENIGKPMENIFRAMKTVIERHADVKIIYPVHMNPSIRYLADNILGDHERIHLIEPLDVVDFHNFISRSYLIVTDSGGIQEEASTFGKPVLVLRNTTERPEGIEAGTLKLVGTDYENVLMNVEQLLSDYNLYSAMSTAKSPYGDGCAAEYISNILEGELCNE